MEAGGAGIGVDGRFGPGGGLVDGRPLGAKEGEVAHEAPPSLVERSGRRKRLDPRAHARAAKHFIQSTAARRLGTATVREPDPRCARHDVRRRASVGNQEVKTEREVTRRCKSSGVQMTGPLAEQQARRREASCGGSCRQSPGPRNTKRIRGGRRKGAGVTRSPRVRVPWDPKPDVIWIRRRRCDGWMGRRLRVLPWEI